MEAALSGGAAYVGFIFFPKSPRYVEPDAAGRLGIKARNRAKAVAVTVDGDDAFLDMIMRQTQPDVMQLHGKETPARAAEVKRRYGLPVIKALSVSTPSDIDKALPFAGIADFVMFDAKAPADSALPGGNGVSFDWSLLKTIGPGLDYFLAGGLNSGNIGDALRIANPPMIDVSSGVETAPGVKDPALIRDFFAAVNRARAA